MIKSNKLELIPVQLIKNNPDKLAFIDKVVKDLNLIVGWHYILDVIWILKQIEEQQLPLGSTILDAGGGYGIIQFCLTRLKYKVISVDFADRQPTIKMLKHFQIVDSDNIKKKFQHDYLKFQKKNTSSYMVQTAKKLKAISLKSSSMWPQRLRNFIYVKTVSKRSAKNDLCPMIFHKADLQDMRCISTNSIDAVVSISVVEHNSQNQVIKVMSELKRVLKNGNPMFITTCSSEKEDWFHEASNGWVYSEKSLHNLFLNSCEKFKSNFSNYNQLMNELRTSDELKSWLHPVYFKSANNGMPWGVWDPKYYPVGLVYDNDKN